MRFLILPCTVLKTLFEFPTKNVTLFFIANGVAMSSPVDLVLADIFLGLLWRKLCSARHSIWFRYADGTITMFDSKATSAFFCITSTAAIIAFYLTFSKTLIIREEKTTETATMEEAWVCDLIIELPNSVNFCFEFL